MEQEQQWKDAIANYYKLILKDIMPYLQDLEDLVKGESASNYYSSKRQKVVTLEEVKSWVHKIASESYGAK